jgi:hypothetical protein
MCVSAQGPQAHHDIVWEGEDTQCKQPRVWVLSLLMENNLLN